MTTEQTTATPGKANSKDDMTDMAVLRTLMATDRSMMAWVRTGLSLISFGFTIYKFLEYARDKLIATGEVPGGFSNPKMIGLFMIGVGILCLILGILENITTIRGLRERHQFTRSRYSLCMAGIILFFGLYLFLGILLKASGIA